MCVCVCVHVCVCVCVCVSVCVCVWMHLSVFIQTDNFGMTRPVIEHACAATTMNSLLIQQVYIYIYIYI